MSLEPYYERDGIVIYHGDCRAILPHLDSVDLVCTDPPYGISHSSNHGASWRGTQIANDGDTSARDDLLAAIDGTPWACFGTWKVAPPKNARVALVWDKGPAFGMGDLSLPWKGSWEIVWIGGDGWFGHRDEGVLRGHIVVSWESKGRVHPHEKPVSLLKELLLKHPARDILDPYCGSGSTLVAARDLGRKCIGIEIEERYAEIAVNRLSQQLLPFGEEEG